MLKILLCFIIFMLDKSNNFIFLMGIINQTIECLDRNFEKHRAYESILNFCLVLKVLNHHSIVGI